MTTGNKTKRLGRLPLCATSRFLTWLQWRANMRAWRKRLRGSRQLARCWGAVKKHPDVRPGYFAVEGEICNIESIYKDSIAHQSWYPSVRQDLDKGSTEFAKITLYYLVRDHPHDKYLVELFVSTLDHRLLGLISDRQCGF